MNPDDDGPPTTPDIASLKCPECRGSGHLFAADERGEATKQLCGVCFGVKFVTRETWERWRARNNSSDQPETD